MATHGLRRLDLATLARVRWECGVGGDWRYSVTGRAWRCRSAPARESAFAGGSRLEREGVRSDLAGIDSRSLAPIPYTQASYREVEVKSTAVAPKRPWQPMRLQFVGHVGDLMKGGTGSRPDGGNSGFDKGNGPT